MTRRTILLTAVLATAPCTSLVIHAVDLGTCPASVEVSIDPPLPMPGKVVPTIGDQLCPSGLCIVGTRVIPLNRGLR